MKSQLVLRLFITKICPFIIAWTYTYAGQAANTTDTLGLIKRIGLSADIGRIIPHTQRFIPVVNYPTLLFEIKYAKQHFSIQNDQKIENFRIVEWVAQYAIFGDRQILGSALSLFPAANIRIYKSPYFNTYFRIGSGLSIINRKFDPIHNPTNNVIGSHLNNITVLGFQFDIKKWRNWDMAAHINFTHFSNGSMQNPNLGINTATAGLTIYNKRESSSKTDVPKPREHSRKLNLLWRSGVALQDNVAGGPKHLAYTGNLLCMIKTSTNNSFGGGIHVGYNNGEYRWLLRRFPESDKNLHVQSTDFSINLANEWMFYNVGLFASVGYYLYDPFYKISPIYFKGGFNYYPFQQTFLKGFCFIGNIKSHFFIADFIELGIGYKW
jgi:hypothetical protein